MTPALDTDDTGPAHDDPRVVQALEAYLADREAGRAPDRAALLAAYADVAGPLAECLDGLDFLQTAAAPVRPADPDRLGDFRLIREIGRGGMGVVYEAEQVSLGRRVALKTLPLAAAPNETDLRRFRHEAQVAAALHHPHIVPVYAVGTESGVHYFAMQFVRGRSLAEVIAGMTPTAGGAGGSTSRSGRERSDPGPAVPPRDAAGWVRQAAEALDHAHRLGVVHRDVKPGNLLLGDDGHLWVADFGLAFAPGQTRLTRPDGLVGTLRYMSPEQIDPGRGVVDHRADLYGLGATLYELLTRSPVFPSPHRGDLIARVLNDPPVPPRRLHPAVPADLETVVLKLLAKDPADRYPSARDLADDLDRFLHGRPIRARRPGRVELALRWAGRHRRTVAAGAAGVAAVVGLLAVNQYRLARERDNTRAEREEARRVIDDMAETAVLRLGRETGTEPAQRDLLLLARGHYERLARAGDRGADDRFQAARALWRVALIDARLGDSRSAGQNYSEAAGRLRALVAAAPTPDRVRELAACLNNRGNLYRAAGRFAEAAEDYAAAVAGWKTTGDAAGCAGAENNLGLVHQAEGRTAAAEECFRSARARFAKLAGEAPGDPAYVAETARCCHNLGNLLADTGRPAEAEAAYRESLALGGKPAHPAHRRDAARTRARLAALLVGRGRADEADPLLREAVAAHKALADTFPLVPAYQSELGSAYREAGVLHLARGLPAAAEKFFRDACDRLAPLTDESEGPAARTEFVRAATALAAVLAGRGEVAEAGRVLRSATQIADQLDRHPPAAREAWARCRLEAAHLALLTGRYTRAEEAVRELTADPTSREAVQGRCLAAESARRAGRLAEAEAAYRAILDRGPGKADGPTRVAALAGLARVSVDLLRPGEAVTHLTAAVAASGPPPAAGPAPWDGWEQADRLATLAELLVWHGKTAEADTLLLRAAAAIGPAAKPFAGWPGTDMALARIDRAAAGALAREGDLPAAEAAARRSADALAGLTARSPAAEFFARHAESLRRLAVVLARREKWDQARAAWAERTRVLVRLTEVAPDAAAFHRELAWATAAPADTLGANDPARGVAAARRAVAVAPADRRNTAALGFALAAAGKPDEAVPLLEEAGRLAPPDPRVFLGLAAAHAGLGKADAARHWRAKYEEAVNGNMVADPDDVFLWRLAGNVLTAR